MSKKNLIMTNKEIKGKWIGADCMSNKLFFDKKKKAKKWAGY